MRTIWREVVCAILELPDGSILLGRKRPNSGAIYPDCWQLPGGGVEPGETHIDALVREIAEELGASFRPNQFTLIDDQGSGRGEKRLLTGETVICEMKFFVYQARLNEAIATAQLPAEGEFAEVRFFPREALSTLKLVPAGIPLFRRIGYLG